MKSWKLTKNLNLKKKKNGGGGAVGNVVGTELTWTNVSNGTSIFIYFFFFCF